MVADSPGGPWKDPLGKALLTEGLVPTDPYDPGIMEVDGEYYIFFGVWDFYTARLNEDMISIAETPKKIIINNPRGPYNQVGVNKENPTETKLLFIDTMESSTCPGAIIILDKALFFLNCLNLIPWTGRA